MPYIDNYVFDAALAKLAEATHIYLCNADPDTYTEATATFDVGVKATPSVGSPADRSPTGRKVTVAAITGGTTTNTDTATHWALVDTGNTRLRSSGALSAPQAMTAGNPWSLAAFDIGIADPT
jgi:hypothetical protein